jgi:glycosyltransferase involved in cell wall biosynthesis
LAKIRIIYVISFIDSALEFEWVIKKIDKEKYDLSLVMLNPKSSWLAAIAHENGVQCTEIEYRSKKNLPSAIWKLYRIFRKEKPSIIHAHLYDASIAAMIAGKLAGVPNRIYTRHHSSYHHVYFKKHVRVDKLVNSLATNIVAVSPLVKKILVEREHCEQKKITVIPHGLDLSLFHNDGRPSSLVNKYNLQNRHPVIGVISRYTEWKGIQYIIPAFRRLLEFYPEAKLLLANANGDYKDKIHELLDQLPAGSFVEIGFEPSVTELYKCMEIFVHTPVDEHSEAFGQIYIEALAMGIPSVFTMSGIAPEIMSDGRNAMVVRHRDSSAIVDAMRRLLESPELRKRLSEQGKMSIEHFTILNKMNNLDKLYTSLTEPHSE